MTDYSKIKTIDELDFQVQRIERREQIQRERLQGHVDFVVRQYNYLLTTIENVLIPIRNKINEYKNAISVVARIGKAIFGRKK
ncbi:MAG: hypothetical protein IJ814_00050 [Paludibacteraceae bacterium]|nr:hypothetical protein [Paludibacteraceae bacterium]